MLTIVVDWTANIISAMGIINVSGEEKKGFAKEFGELVESLSDASGGDVLDVEVFKEGWEHQNTATFLAGIWDTVFSKVVKLLMNEGVLSKAVADKLLIVPTVWNVIAGAVNGVLAFVDLAYSGLIDMFTLRGDLGGVFEPLDLLLPDAELGCGYKATVSLLKPDPNTDDHAWTLVSLNPLPPGSAWDFNRYGPNNSKLELLRPPEMPIAFSEIGSALIELEIAVFPIVGGVTGAEIGREVFQIGVKPGGPVISAVDLSADPSPHPGAEVPVRVRATRCGDGTHVTSVVVSGEVLAIDTELALADDDWFEGTLDIAATAPDGLVSVITVTATSDDGDVTTSEHLLTVANAPPELMGATLSARPDQTLVLTLTVVDGNFDGTNFSEVPFGAAAVVDAAGFTTNPPLEDLSFTWDQDASDGTSGTIVLTTTTPLTVSPSHPDNDAPGGGEGVPHLVQLHIEDDDGAVAEPATLAVTVENVAPVVLNANPTAIAIGGEQPTPIEFVLRVSDANGTEDIGFPEILGDNPGLTPAGAKTAGQEEHFTWTLDVESILAGCPESCTVEIVVPDADDDPDNAGLSATFVLLLNIGDYYPCGPDLPCPSTCGAGEVVLERTCTNGSCGPPVAGKDCASEGGEVCRGGVCVPPCTVASDCPDDPDMPCSGTTHAAWSCEAGGCHKTLTECAATGKVCEEDGCVPGCLEDAGCPGKCAEGGVAQDYACDVVLHQCILIDSHTCSSELVCAKGLCTLGCPNGVVDCPPSACVTPHKLQSWCCDEGACVEVLTSCAESGFVCDAAAVACAPGCVTSDDCTATCSGEVAESRFCNPEGICEVWYSSPCKPPDVCLEGLCNTPCSAGCPAPTCTMIGGKPASIDWGCEDGFCLLEPTICPEGQGCANATCAAECAGPLDCPSTCADDKLQLRECGDEGICIVTVSLQCGEDEVCAAGQCQKACDTVFDCGAPECATDALALSWECLPEGYCNQKQTACGDGYKCGPGGECLPVCASILDCPDTCDEQGRAVHRNCDVDDLCTITFVDDCPAVGESCVDGNCAEVCETDADCGLLGGKPQCFDTTLVTPFCRSDGTCDTTLTPCAGMGLACLPTGACGKPCGTASDCDPGQSCEGGKCVKTCAVDGDCPATACGPDNVRVTWSCDGGHCIEHGEPCGAQVGYLCEEATAQCVAGCSAEESTCADTCAGDLLEHRGCSAEGACLVVSTDDCGVGACQGGACVPGSCCGVNLASGCADPECSALVCAAQPACCAETWGADCVDQAVAFCGTLCVVCQEDADCDDGVDCTIDTCGGDASCVHAAAEGTCCSSDAVVQADCDATGCQLVVVQDCASNGEGCHAGACAPKCETLDDCAALEGEDGSLVVECVDGLCLAAETIVAESPSFSSSDGPHNPIVRASDGTIYMAFITKTDGWQIKVVRWVAAASKWAKVTDAIATGDSIGTDIYAVDMAIDSGDHLHVSWSSRYPYPTFGQWYRRVELDGAVGPLVELGKASKSNAYPRVAVDSQDIVWLIGPLGTWNSTLRRSEEPQAASGTFTNLGKIAETVQVQRPDMVIDSEDRLHFILLPLHVRHRYFDGTWHENADGEEGKGQKLGESTHLGDDRHGRLCADGLGNVHAFIGNATDPAYFLELNPKFTHRQWSDGVWGPPTTVVTFTAAQYPDATMEEIVDIGCVHDTGEVLFVYPDFAGSGGLVLARKPLDGPVQLVGPVSPPATVVNEHFMPLIAGSLFPDFNRTSGRADFSWEQRTGGKFLYQYGSVLLGE